MREQDVGVLVAVVGGAIGFTGWIRYFAGTDVQTDRAFVIIEPDTLEPLIVVGSDHAAAWLASTATTRRIESTFSQGVPPIQRVIEIIGDRTRGHGRVGTLSLHDTLSVPEYQALVTAFPDLDLVDLTKEADEIRQVKSPLEIAAIQDMGAVLTKALDLFAELAGPGRSMVEAAADVEGFLRGQGCLGGRIKYSLGERPYTIPPLPGQRFTPRDIFVFQFVFMSPLGYWYELSRLYSFRPLPRETARRLRAMEHAIEETARLAVPGNTFAMIAAASDRVFADHGFTVIGKHTWDCHTQGTEICDGEYIVPEEWELKENAVLALHPASLLEGDLGFFLIDNVVVRPGGAMRLAPQNPFYKYLGM